MAEEVRSAETGDADATQSGAIRRHVRRVLDRLREQQAAPVPVAEQPAQDIELTEPEESRRTPVE